MFDGSNKTQLFKFQSLEFIKSCYWKGKYIIITKIEGICGEINTTFEPMASSTPQHLTHLAEVCLPHNEIQHSD